ncbi:glycosyltransferase family 4 protein [Flavobacterium croceum]|uniref:glycosyltransferase family 4 protein n=1 Tax=Flavobacterium croceum TaxID=370975 RepID=UPI0024A95017|nr:glycosyltransferase family 4 protein [Flavobacterium croceum]
MTKKVKVFLGGFINYTNAQNLNCLALAKHLDKEKFTVYTLELFSGNLESQQNKIKGVHIFNCFKPYRISGYLGFLWGIWHCDVAYLPKGEHWKFNRFILKFLGKKSFSTIEGIFDDTACLSIVKIFGSNQNFIDSKKYFTRLYSITCFMNQFNFEKLQIKTEERALYLGVDNINQYKPKTNFNFGKIIMIGNDLVRKGVFDYLDIAESFKNIEFLLAGSGNGKIDINAEIKKRNLTNVNYLGMVTSTQRNELLKDCSLHILPSRSEGFPKVTLETAAAGVPSIVYGDYGAEEWITHGENGWVVNTAEDIKTLISELKNKPEELERISKNTVNLATSFDWKVKIKDWEEEIIKIYKD